MGYALNQTTKPKEQIQTERGKEHVMDNKKTPLERPLQIGQRTAKNRFVIQPFEGSDATPEGRFSELTLTRYENLFKGGAAVVVMEGVTMQREDSLTRASQLSLDVNDPESRAEWEHFLQHKQDKYPDTLLLVQLHHSGEIADPNIARRISVKPLLGHEGVLVDADYIEGVIASFVEAARFLAQIGVDGVDLKFCHGYLGSQILRPYNDRDWKYGGSFENRARFAYELCEKVRAVVPDSFLVGAKVGIWEEMPGGMGTAGPDSPLIDPSEPLQLCKGLESRGANFFIETLGNCYITWNLMCPDNTAPEHVYQHMTAARLLKQNLRPETAVICSGLSLLRDGRNIGFNSVEPEKNSLLYWGNTCIENGDFDMIALGRQSLADPALPQKYIDRQQDAIHWCRCCNLCVALSMGGRPAGCAVHNPIYRKSFKEMKENG